MVMRHDNKGMMKIDEIKKNTENVVTFETNKK